MSWRSRAVSTIQRTKERFKYRNLAVMQGSILGNEKLVLITCANPLMMMGLFIMECGRWQRLQAWVKAPLSTVPSNRCS